MLNEKIKKSQNKLLLEIIPQMSKDVFLKNIPCDKVFSQYCRKNRKIGSRDRKLLSKIFYSFFRWWGWLKSLNTGDFKNWNNSDWERCFIGTFILDNHNDSISELWGYNTKNNLTKKSSSDILEKMEIFRKYFSLSDIHLDQLFPDNIPEIEFKKYSFEKFAQLQQTRPPVWIRTQRALKSNKLLNILNDYGLTFNSKINFSNALFSYDPKVNFNTLSQYNEGYFEVQDAASQCVGLICEQFEGKYWWDMCAGAGGKSIHLANLNKDRFILATDIRKNSLRELKKRAKRAKLNNIKSRLWDGEELLLKQNQFDNIILDTPCSCSGTWRRNPSIRWQISSKKIQEYVIIQKKLLQVAVKHLRVNGVLIYITCSFLKEENIDIIQNFLKTNPDFSFAEFKHPISAKVCDRELNILWDELDNDFMFIACLKKNSTIVDKLNKPF